MSLPEFGEPKLREDSDPYCILWLGFLFLSSYCFSFIYSAIIDLSYLVTIGALLLPAMGFPILLVPFFTSYFRRERGRVKVNMLAIGAFLSLIYILIAYPLGGVLLSSWGIGSAIFVAAGFAMRHTTEEATTRGIMDVSALHYGPESEPEPELEIELEPDTGSVVPETPVVTETESEPVEETPEPMAESVTEEKEEEEERPFE